MLDFEIDTKSAGVKFVLDVDDDDESFKVGIISSSMVFQNRFCAATKAHFFFVLFGRFMMAEANANTPKQTSQNPQYYVEPKYTLVKTIDGHKKGVSCVEFSPDGNLLASGCN